MDNYSCPHCGEEGRWHGLKCLGKQKIAEELAKPLAITAPVLKFRCICGRKLIGPGMRARITRTATTALAGAAFTAALSLAKRA